MPPEPLEITLDRVRRFSLTPTDWRDAARRLSAIADRHVSTTRLLMLLGESDYDALSCVVWAGCRADDDRLTPERVWQALDRRLQQGRELEDIASVVLTGLRRAGIIKDRPRPEVNGGPEVAAETENPHPPATSSGI